jgi:hypothetical protein
MTALSMKRLHIMRLSITIFCILVQILDIKTLSITIIKCDSEHKIFHEIGFFNEADTLDSSSILIYSHLMQENLYTVKLARCRVN